MAASTPLERLEHRRRMFWSRTVRHSSIAIVVLVASLGFGMWGFWYYQGLGWRDSFLNASMLLGGMGPVETNLRPDAKIFAGVYALFAGLVFIGVAGVLLAPSVQRLMHRMHWGDAD